MVEVFNYVIPSLIINIKSDSAGSILRLVHVMHVHIYGCIRLAKLIVLVLIQPIQDMISKIRGCISH